VKINGGCEPRKTSAINKAMKGVNVNSEGVMSKHKQTDTTK